MAARLCRLWRISRRRGYLSLEPLARPLTKADLLHLPAFILWLMTLLTRPPWPRPCQRNSWTASWSADPGKHKSKKKKKTASDRERSWGGRRANYHVVLLPTVAFTPPRSNSYGLQAQ